MKERSLGRTAATRGEFHRRNLEELFQNEGLDITSMAAHGVLSLDVEEGAEIAAFAPYKPKIFVATEPKSSLYPDDREHNRDTHLKAIAQAHPDVQILRMDTTDAIEHLREGEMKFGLITHLNIFPELIDYGYVRWFFTETGNLLVPGGAAVLSILEDDDSIGVPLYRGGYHALRELGFRIHDPVPQPSTSSGTLFMIGVKPAPQAQAA